MVIDGSWGTVGSTNFDRRSFALNDEVNLLVYDQAVAHRLEQIFQQDLRHSRKLTYIAWNNRGAVGRFLELLSFPIRDQL